MNSREELEQRVQELMSANSKMAGRIGAIGRYMDAVGVPKIAPVNKRVELLTILYQKVKIEMEELALMRFQTVDDDDV